MIPIITRDRSPWKESMFPRPDNIILSAVDGAGSLEFLLHELESLGEVDCDEDAIPLHSIKSFAIAQTAGALKSSIF